MRHHGLAVVIGCLQLGLVASVAAQPRSYHGAHPVDHAGNWHATDDEHLHDTLPVGTAAFASGPSGSLVFLGDPRSHGYAGQVYAYRGPHPLPAGLDADCGLVGAHSHPFAPEGAFREVNGEYVFAGALRGDRPMLSIPRHAVRGSVAPPAHGAVPALPGWIHPGVYCGSLGPDGLAQWPPDCVTPLQHPGWPWRMGHPARVRERAAGPAERAAPRDPAPPPSHAEADPAPRPRPAPASSERARGGRLPSAGSH